MTTSLISSASSALASSITPLSQIGAFPPSCYNFFEDSLAYCRNLFSSFWKVKQDESWEMVEAVCPIYSLTQEEAQKLSLLMPLAAQASELSYQITPVVRQVELVDCLYEVSFLRRKTGLGIEGTPALFLKGEEGKVIIAVPGTVDANDWFSNLSSDITSLKDTSFLKDSDDVTAFFSSEAAAHVGFLSVTLSILEDLKSQMLSLNSENVEEIIITGHSQGAAVAQLLALYLTTHKKFLRISEGTSIICHSFASPRVFSKDSYPFIIRNLPHLINISHPADIVTRFPFASHGFRHAGIEMRFSLENLKEIVAFEAASDLTKSMSGDLKAAANIASFAYKAVNPTLWHESIVIAHSMKNYAEMCCSLNSIEYGEKILLGKQIEIEENPAEKEMLTLETQFRALYHRFDDENLDHVTFERL